MKTENPKAFPNDATPREDGMTLRDYFAAKAMQSVMVGEAYNHVKTSEEVANWAYTITDAMLRERLKQKP